MPAGLANLQAPRGQHGLPIWRTPLPTQEAEAEKARFLASLPKLQAFLEHVVEDCRRTGGCLGRGGGAVCKDCWAVHLPPGHQVCGEQGHHVGIASQALLCTLPLP